MKVDLLLVLSIVVAATSLTVCVAAETDKPRPPDVSEITLTRSRPGEDLPTDTLTLRADGTAHYTGTKNVPRIGSYNGVMPKSGFRDFFPLLSAQFVALQEKPYSTGKPTETIGPVIIHVVQDGKSIEIRDWCPGLDKRLWSFEMSVRGVASEISWQREF